MRKTTLALLVAAFSFGLATVDVDAQGRRHHNRNHLWHNGKHYQGHGLKKHRAKHVKKHHKRVVVKPIVVATIDVSSQSLNVAVNGWSYGTWAVSTARRGYSTPRGTFGVQRLAAVYYSKKYDNSPMPHSVFFYGGNAIHGSYHLRQLGSPASHGCVRLAPEHAEELFALVEKYGPKYTRIIVQE
jgi:lipoprotein-anchoring transpeptidase ErfK/SrfK